MSNGKSYCTAHGFIKGGLHCPKCDPDLAIDNMMLGNINIEIDSSLSGTEIEWRDQDDKVLQKITNIKPEWLDENAPWNIDEETPEPTETKNDVIARSLIGKTIKSAKMDENDDLKLTFDDGSQYGVTYSCYGGVNLTRIKK